MRTATTSILGRDNFGSNTGRSGDENDDFNDGMVEIVVFEVLAALRFESDSRMFAR